MIVAIALCVALDIDRLVEQAGGNTKPQ